MVFLSAAAIIGIAAVSAARATDCAVNPSTTSEAQGTLIKLERVDAEPGFVEYFRAELQHPDNDDVADVIEFAIDGRPQEMEVGNEYHVTLYDYSAGLAEPRRFGQLVAFLHTERDCTPGDSIFGIGRNGERQEIPAPKSNVKRFVIIGGGVLFAAFLAVQQARSRLQTKDPDTL